MIDNAVNIHLKILKILVSLSLRCHESTVLYYYVYNIFQCQDTLVQFGSFLSMQLSTEEFVKRLPPIDKMVSEYHVPADAAFFLSRSLYSYEINVSISYNFTSAHSEESDQPAHLCSLISLHCWHVNALGP